MSLDAQDNVVWDIRKFTAPIAVVNGLCNLYEETECIFAPDDQSVLTGVSVKKGSNRAGSLFVGDSLTLSPLTEPIQLVPDSSAVSLGWHVDLEQIFVGNSNGSVTVLYDPEKSRRGILLPLAKAPASEAKDVVVALSSDAIHNPNALPLFRSTAPRSLKRQRVKSRKDPIASHLPERPLEGPGMGGRLGSSVTQAIMKTVIKDTRRDEDPREALLKYAAIAEQDPIFVAPAYRMTQPKTIFDEELLRREAEVAEKRHAEEEKTRALEKKLAERDSSRRV